MWGYMMSGFWGAQKEMAMNNLVSSAASAAASMRNVQELKKEAQARRVGYAHALAQAKVTGVMPEEFQGEVPKDMLGRQVGIKVVALRELKKAIPNHPLVVSQNVRSNIATQTMINYNRADRPGGVDFADYAPGETAAQQIFSMK